MKKAYVFKDRTGWWKVECEQSGKQIGGFCDSEAEALRLAAAEGYLVC